MKDKKNNAIDLLDNLIGMIDDSQGNDYDGALKVAISAMQKLEKLEEEYKRFTMVGASIDEVYMFTVKVIEVLGG